MRKKSLIGQKTNPFTCRCTVNDYKKYRTEIYYKKQIYIPLITRYSPWQLDNLRAKVGSIDMVKLYRIHPKLYTIKNLPTSIF